MIHDYLFESREILYDLSESRQSKCQRRENLKIRFMKVSREKNFLERRS